MRERIDIKNMSREQLLAYILKNESKPKKQKGRGRPQVKLMADEGRRDEMMTRVRLTADKMYYPRLKKFRIINKVELPDKFIGKALFWGLMYEVLVDLGYIKEGNNMVLYHDLLAQELDDSDLLCPREKIGDIVRDWNEFQLMDTDEGKLYYSKTTQVKAAKFFYCFDVIKEVFVNCQK